MAEDGQGNLYVAYRGGGGFKKDSIAKFGPGLTNMRLLGMTLQQPQGLLVDNAGNIIVVESHAQRIDVFPPGSKTASVTVTIFGTSYLEGLAMQNSETTLWVSSWGDTCTRCPTRSPRVRYQVNMRKLMGQQTESPSHRSCR
jgi:hypothetical protein